jgi:hypothetical protein
MATISDKEKARQAHILISRYVTLFKEKHKRAPTINRYSAKWGMMDVIDSVGVDRANEILAYYFSTTHEKHDLEFFYKNFDKIEANLLVIRQDRANRARIMAETAKRVREAEHQQ